jgi:hypothetical protein
MDKLTREQSAIIGAFTGVLCGPFEALHEYVEKVMGRPVWTHEMGSEQFSADLKEKSRADFMSIVHKEPTP